MKQTTEKIIAAAEERGWINENEILSETEAQPG
jgi:hypothetical protein